MAETKVILKDLLNLTENKVTIDLIQTLVCKFFKISKNEMLSSRRSRYLVRPRQTAIYLSKILTSKSLPEIGRAFSNRDHTTVIHSVKTIEKLRKQDNELNLFNSDQLNITEEIKKFISTEINTSVRELIGSLNRIVSFSRIYNKVPSLSEVRIILKDLLNINENKVNIDSIQTLVCKFYKISKNEMLSPRRSRYLVRPRQTAIYLSKMLTSKSLPEIGRAFSNRDHTTVIHSVKTIEKLRKEDNELNMNIDSLKNKILYNKENEV